MQQNTQLKYKQIYTNLLKKNVQMQDINKVQRMQSSKEVLHSILQEQSASLYTEQQSEAPVDQHLLR